MDLSTSITEAYGDLDGKGWRKSKANQSQFQMEQSLISLVKGVLFANAWDHSAGSSDVFEVFLSELLEHHLLLFRHTHEIQRNKTHEKRPACKPVLQQQSLCKCPEQVGRIHRMPYITVYTVRYKRVFLPDLQRRRPVAAKVGVRSPQQENCACERRSPYPAQPSRQVIIGKIKPRQKQIQQRQKQTHAADADKHNIQYTLFSPGGSTASASGRIDLAYHRAQNKTNKKNDFEDIVDSKQFRLPFQILPLESICPSEQSYSPVGLRQAKAPFHLQNTAISMPAIATPAVGRKSFEMILSREV